MRRLLVVFALVAASCGVLGAGASTASAANCYTVYNTTIYWNGNLAFETVVTNCQGVDKVEYGFACCNQASVQDAGLIDVSVAGWPLHRAGLICCGSTVKPIYSTATYVYMTYGTAPWCPVGMTTHYVKSVGVFRIHNTASLNGSWGIWHRSEHPAEPIWC